MTANEVLMKSMALLGYSDNDGNSQLTQRIRNRALPLFNLVYNDLRQVCELKHKPVISLSDDKNTPSRVFTPNSSPSNPSILHFSDCGI